MRDDNLFINAEDLTKLPECICALANSSGGSVVVDSDSLPEFDVPPEIVYDAEKLSDDKIAVHVQPLKWNLRPAVLHGRVYRRIEGENVISGRRACSVMSMDALTFSRDDFPVRAMLDEDCMNEFRDVVVNLRMGYENLKRDEFFRRTYAYSGKHLTFAGALMFGKFIRVRAVLNEAKIEAYNIWRAYTDILPRLTHNLSRDCTTAFREMFINALLHSDYNISRLINVAIKSRPLRAVIDNPAIIRGTIRNHRLAKMFVLSGISRCRHEGIERIRTYDPNFELEQDMLNFRVKSSIHLEGIKSLPQAIIL